MTDHPFTGHAPEDAATPPQNVATEVKQAVSQFVQHFKGFQDDVTEKLKQTEERMTMLDRKTQTAAQPHLAAA